MSCGAERILYPLAGKLGFPRLHDGSDMHSFRADSRLFRDALERLGEASSIPPGGAEPAAGEAGAGMDFVPDRREVEPPRVIGRLVALNGTQGVISCPLETSEEDWSVGHLITIVHKTARLVGAVCDVGDRRRSVVGDGGQHRPRHDRIERRDRRRLIRRAGTSVAASARFPRWAQRRIAYAPTIFEPSMRFEGARGLKSAG